MTSLFKQQVSKDIKSVFLNFNEFAEIMTVELGRYNEVDIPVVIDGDLLKERYKATDALFIDGVMSLETFIYIAIGDLPAPPVRGEMMRINGQLYIIKDINENMGVYEMTVTANEF